MLTMRPGSSHRYLSAIPQNLWSLFLSSHVETSTTLKRKALFAFAHMKTNWISAGIYFASPLNYENVSEGNLFLREMKCISFGEGESGWRREKCNKIKKRSVFLLSEGIYHLEMLELPDDCVSALNDAGKLWISLIEEIPQQNITGIVHKELLKLR